ncbi:hypothetical protein H0B56_08295 [Haloechinothrix sp. YIM 98757]|uniref:Uncharacterized protein n=1 Tax=Haloechinothrix aidingensis TaxID=2752311 RepID=A0A838A8A4_9PSEU|nr:gephyrin-like molybdotransferase receptor GlpR [Haloechinothrix aidingensis]MBA0125535.1 hypothetical protein [Haloechinothrix aidingensis]
MPSSLMIVALAAAWLVVLVPMVARKRQEISRTGEDALAARVVRSGSVRTDMREESMMSESAERAGRSEDHGQEYTDAPGDAEPREAAAPDGAARQRSRMERDGDAGAPERDERDERDADTGSRYRRGRGGFDPEAAEMAARAKYAFRQRVVLALLGTVLLTALLAGFVHAGLWWVNALAVAGLAGYLGYLRRQVRIENEIRQRRMARLGGSRRHERNRELAFDDHDVADDEPPAPEYDERPSAVGEVRRHSRPARRQAEVLDIDDEDPAFHELDEPDYPAYRKAVGE